MIKRGEESRLPQKFERGGNMRKKTYRFNKASGIIHYIPRCCCSGKARNTISYKDNYEESYTYEEAVNVLNSRCVQAFKCKKCDWPKEENLQH